MNPARFQPRALATARHAAALSTYELARQIDVSRQQITNWENGRWVPTPPRLVRLAEVLDVDPLLLMLEPDQPPTIAELRVARRGITQIELAREIGARQQTYSLLERGRQPLTDDLRARLATALDLDQVAIEAAYAEGVRLYGGPGVS